MHPLADEYIQHVQRVHDAHGSETDFFYLARSLGLTIAPGTTSAYYPGIPPTVTLESGIYSARYAHRVGMHEVAHHLLVTSGIEDQIMRLHGDWPGAQDTIELFARLGAAYLQLPDTLLRDAQRLHGDTAQALAHLYAHSTAPLGTVLRRWAHAHEDASRAAWTTSGNYVRDVTAHNLYLPFWRYSRMPEPSLSIPEEANATFTPIPHTYTGLIGVCAG